MYPAIDVLSSLSRLMFAVTTPEHCAAAHKLRALIARHREIELLIQVGEYRSGSDQLADEAIAKLPAIRDFLQQSSNAPEAAQVSVQRLLELVR